MAPCQTDTQSSGKGVRGICRTCQVSGGYGTQEEADAWVVAHRPVTRN